MMKRIGSWAAWAVLAASLALAARAEQAVPGYAGVDVFDLPALSSAEMLIIGREAMPTPQPRTSTR